ncbi:MAG: autotransporter domain-containing protein [Verrucomicrobiota bacterium]
MKTRRARAVLFSLTLLTFIAAPARAQLEVWDGSANNNWFNKANWTPPTAPGVGPAATDNVQIDVGPVGLPTTNFARIANPGATARSLNVGTGSGDNGELRVVNTGTLSIVTQDFNIGNGGTGVVKLTDMSMTTVAQNMVLAVQSNSSGNLTVGDSATLSITGQLRVADLGMGALTITDNAMVTAARLDVGTSNGGVGTVDLRNSAPAQFQLLINGNASIGTSGNGTLTARDAGTMHVTQSIFIGNNALGVGMVIVRGQNSTGLFISQVVADQNIDVGASGNGTLEVRDGALVQGENIRIGRDSGSKGTTLVTGVGPVSGGGSSLRALNDLSVGGTQVGPGGDGALRIVNGGAVIVDNNMWVWGPGPGPGNKGVLAIDSTYHLTVTNTLTFDGGRLHFLEDGVDFTNDAFLGNSQNPSGIFVDTDGHTDTISGMLTGPGRLWKRDPGTLILTNDNTFTGRTIVEEGTLQIDGAVGGSVSVRANGTLTGVYDGVADNVGRNLRNRGIVSPGDMPGEAATFLVTRDFTNRTTGTYVAEVGGPNEGVDSDLLRVHRNVQLDGGTMQVVRLNNFMPAPGDRVTVIRTDPICSVNGTFDTVVPIGWGLIQPVADYTDDTVDVVFELGSFAGLPGLTPNQQAVAEALDQAFSDECLSLEVFRFLGNLPPNQLSKKALDLIAPEEMTAIYEMSFSYATVRNENLIRRMEDIRAGAGGYCPVVVEVPTGKDYNPPISDKNVATGDKNAVTPAILETRECHWGFFLNGTGDFASVEPDFNASGYDVETGSLIAGADYRIGNHFAIGIDGGYVGGDAETFDNGRIQQIGGRVGGYATVFGTLFGAKVHLDGAADSGWNRYDTRRTALSTNFPENASALGETDGDEFNAMISYGGDWTFGCLNVGTWSTLQYTDVNINDFTEKGSLLPLHFPSQNQESLRSTSGVRMSYDKKFGRTIFRPEVRAAWFHEYGDKAYAIKSNFIDCPTSFTVHGPELGRDAALVGGGFSVQWSDCLSTYVYYDGIVGRSNYDSNALSGGFRVGF